MQYIHLDNLSNIPELNCLKHIKPAIRSIYIRGKFQPQLFNNCVAVVGSRRMTHYGRQVIDKLIPELVFSGKTIVSGFMYGVDQYAHQACVSAGGTTIAVLGWGIDTPMEPADQLLAKRIIAAGGLILSEWENQIGTLWTFPVRNRIVAGLAAEVYVIEAAQKSGSLLTADLATKLHKKVWAIPGPVTSKTSVGTNQLIKSNQAEMWLGSLPVAPHLSNDPILKLLASESLSPNQLARQLGQPIGHIGARLSTLEITGQIIHREGKYYLTHAD